MLFTMFVYFILWAILNANRQEANLAALKEVALNYKSLIEGYKKDWTFDDFEIKSKASKKFSFETYYASGDPEKINNTMSSWTLISWFIVIAIWDILVWNLLPRVINPILSGFDKPGITNEAIGAIAFLVPIGYMVFISIIQPRFSKKDGNTRAKMMSSDLYVVEQALDKHNRETLVSRTAAQLRVQDENSVAKKMSSSVTSASKAVSSGGNSNSPDESVVINGDVVRGNVIVNRPNKKD